MEDESRDEMIRRLKEEIGKLLEERLPHKGSTIDEIERITEEIGREVERKIEEGVTRREGRGYVGSLAVVGVLRCTRRTMPKAGRLCILIW